MGVRFEPPLAQQRIALARLILRHFCCSEVVDLGCGEGRLLATLLNDNSVTAIVGVDASEGVLREAGYLLRAKVREDGRFRLAAADCVLWAGDAANASAIPTDFAAGAGGRRGVTCIEVLEHVPEPRVAGLAAAIFDRLRPEVAVISTPNGGANCLLGPRRYTSGFRHADHHFEWGETEFRAFCAAAAAAAAAADPAAGRAAGPLPAYELTFIGVGEFYGPAAGYADDGSEESYGWPRHPPVSADSRSGDTYGWPRHPPVSADSRSGNSRSGAIAAAPYFTARWTDAAELEFFITPSSCASCESGCASCMGEPAPTTLFGRPVRFFSPDETALRQRYFGAFGPATQMAVFVRKAGGAPAAAPAPSNTAPEATAPPAAPPSHVATPPPWTHFTSVHLPSLESGDFHEFHLFERMLNLIRRQKRNDAFYSGGDPEKLSCKIREAYTFDEHPAELLRALYPGETDYATAVQEYAQDLGFRVEGETLHFEGPVE